MAKALDDTMAIHGETDASTNLDASMPPILQYGATLLLVAVAALIAVVAGRFVPGPGLTLIFVLPVVIAGAWLGWGPSLVATAAGVLAFDFFFTQPYYSLQIDDPAEIWAASLLLIIACVVGAVAWQSRQRAFEARRVADQAEGLYALAHAVIQGRPALAVAAATALGRIFAAPAAVLREENGALEVLASSNGATLSKAEVQAAEDALQQERPMRAHVYPHDTSRFDVWPVNAGGQGRYVLAVDFGRSIHERPENTDRFLEIVAAYLASREGGPALQE